MKNKHELMDMQRNVEVATLWGTWSMQRTSTLTMNEGHWDDAWVQMVVLTSVVAVKSGKDMMLGSNPYLAWRA